jgi:hypothetical protein
MMKLGRQRQRQKHGHVCIQYTVASGRSQIAKGDPAKAQNAKQDYTARLFFYLIIFEKNPSTHSNIFGFRKRKVIINNHDIKPTADPTSWLEHILRK